MTGTERTSWMEILEPSQKFEVVVWSVLARKRYYIFDHWWNIGKASRIAYRDVRKLSYKEVRQTVKFIKENRK